MVRHSILLVGVYLIVFVVIAYFATGSVLAFYFPQLLVCEPDNYENDPDPLPRMALTGLGIMFFPVILFWAEFEGPSGCVILGGIILFIILMKLLRSHGAKSGKEIQEENK